MDDIVADLNQQICVWFGREAENAGQKDVESVWNEELRLICSSIDVFRIRRRLIWNGISLRRVLLRVCIKFIF